MESNEVSQPTRTPRHPGWVWGGVAMALCVLIIVPFLVFGAEIESWTAAMLETPRHHPAISGLILGGLLASDILLPVPSSIVSTGCGLLLGFLPGMLVSALGMVISCALGYALAARWGRPIVNRLVGENSLHEFERLYGRHGRWLLVAARPVPVLAEVSVLFAGLGKMPPLPFMLLTTLSNLGISLVYAGIGAWAKDLNSFGLAVAASIVLPGLAMLIIKSTKGV
jgi:uncharacterized membrane protein YdjX (TVP38/TMEM64 family)